MIAFIPTGLWFTKIFIEGRMSVLAVLLIGVLALAAGDERPAEYYPERWEKIDAKAVIDNERLFMKYKECYMKESNVGCPNDVADIKRVIPEMIDTLCAKCSPELVKLIKFAADYTCKTRHDDFNDVRLYYDPDGSIAKRAQEKYGYIDCKF